MPKTRRRSPTKDQAEHEEHEHVDEHGHHDQRARSPRTAGHTHSHEPLPVEQREVTAMLVLTASIGDAPDC